MTRAVAAVFTAAPETPMLPLVAENVTVVPLTVPAERVIFAVVVSETVPMAAETFPASAMLPVLVSVISPEVEAAKLVMLSAPAFTRSMPPFVEVAERLLSAVSITSAAPMPVAAVSESVLAVTSAPPSAPDSSMLSAELIVTVSPEAVTLSTSTFPLVVVVSEILRLDPPAVSVVAVKSPDVALSVMAPFVVVTEAASNPSVASLMVIAAPAPVVEAVTAPVKSLPSARLIAAPPPVSVTAPAVESCVMVPV